VLLAKKSGTFDLRWCVASADSEDGDAAAGRLIEPALFAYVADGPGEPISMGQAEGAEKMTGDPFEAHRLDDRCFISRGDEQVR
jgi:hypothetical protein